MKNFWTKLLDFFSGGIVQDEIQLDDSFHAWIVYLENGRVGCLKYIKQSSMFWYHYEFKVEAPNLIEGISPNNLWYEDYPIVFKNIKTGKELGIGDVWVWNVNTGGEVENGQWVLSIRGLYPMP